MAEQPAVSLAKLLKRLRADGNGLALCNLPGIEQVKFDAAG